MSRLVLVTGSRTWTNREAIRSRLVRLEEGAEVIHGGARGADSIAAAIARSLGITERAYLPEWETYGRRAGIVRNLKMLEEWPDVVLAFWDGRSTGTGHVVTEANRRGIPVEVVTS